MARIISIGGAKLTIKAVFFDLDDTLHDHLQPFSNSIKTTFPEYYKLVEVEFLYKKFRHFSDILWKNYSSNLLSLEELRIRRVIQAFKSFDIQIPIEQAKQFQSHYELDSRHLQLFPDVIELLETLKRNGLFFGIITNGPVAHQFTKISSLGLLDYVSRNLIYISDGVGIAKPNPGIFNYVAERTGYLPHEMVYVGDSWENDVAAPLDADWQSIWYNHRKRKPETHHLPLAEIDSLSSLIAILNSVQIAH